MRERIGGKLPILVSHRFGYNNIGGRPSNMLYQLPVRLGGPGAERGKVVPHVVCQPTGSCDTCISGPCCRLLSRSSYAWPICIKLQSSVQASSNNTHRYSSMTKNNAKHDSPLPVYDSCPPPWVPPSHQSADVGKSCKHQNVPELMKGLSRIPWFSSSVSWAGRRCPVRN